MTTRKLIGLIRLLGFKQAVLFAFHRLRRTKRVQLRVSGFPTPLVCRTNYSDIRVLWDIFGEHGVDVPLADPPQLIVDGGANVGYTSAFLAHRFPQAQVIAVEPDPENCELIRENCRDYPNVSLIRGALWTSSASIVIDNPQAHSWAFRVREVAPGMPNSLPGITLSEILRQSKSRMIDLLKLDIEGAEEMLFGAGSAAWLDRTRVILMEVHGEAAAAVVRCAVSKWFSQLVQGERWLLTRIVA